MTDQQVADIRLLVEKALTEIPGPDADAVAAFLRGKNIKGQRRVASTCVLALYLARLPHGLKVEVNPSSKFGGTVLLFLPDRHPPLSIKLPDHVNRFALRFDCSAYPDLVLV